MMSQRADCGKPAFPKHSFSKRWSSKKKNASLLFYTPEINTFFVELFKNLSAVDGVPRFVQQVVRLSVERADVCCMTPLHPGGTLCPVGGFAAGFVCSLDAGCCEDLDLLAELSFVFTVTLWKWCFSIRRTTSLCCVLECLNRCQTVPNDPLPIRNECRPGRPPPCTTSPHKGGVPAGRAPLTSGPSLLTVPPVFSLLLSLPFFFLSLPPAQRQLGVCSGASS